MRRQVIKSAASSLNLPMLRDLPWEWSESWERLIGRAPSFSCQPEDELLDGFKLDDGLGFKLDVLLDALPAGGDALLLGTGVMERVSATAVGDGDVWPAGWLAIGPSNSLIRPVKSKPSGTRSTATPRWASNAALLIKLLMNYYGFKINIYLQVDFQFIRIQGVGNSWLGFTKI